MDPKACLDCMDEVEFLTVPGLELDPSILQCVASRNTDCATEALR
jgi:hypothetical protein